MPDASCVAIVDIHSQATAEARPVLCWDSLDPSGHCRSLTNRRTHRLAAGLVRHSRRAGRGVRRTPTATSSSTAQLRGRLKATPPRSRDPVNGGDRGTVSVMNRVRTFRESHCLAIIIPTTRSPRGRRGRAHLARPAFCTTQTRGYRTRVPHHPSRLSYGASAGRHKPCTAPAGAIAAT